MPPLFSAGKGGAKMNVDTSGAYNPGITDEIDKKIRHMKPVMQRGMAEAVKLRNAAGEADFDVVASVNPDNQRPRFYVAPSTSVGIHLEISNAVLLKAALAMGVG